MGRGKGFADNKEVQDLGFTADHILYGRSKPRGVTPPPIFSLKENMIEVQSSNVEQIGYDKNFQSLFVKFNDQETIYRMDNFPEEEYEAFLESSSKGKFFTSILRVNIRAASFKA